MIVSGRQDGEIAIAIVKDSRRCRIAAHIVVLESSFQGNERS
jgi:hypothetical protein